MTGKRLKVLLARSFIIGIVMVLLGVLFYVVVLPNIIAKKINEALALSNGSESFERFERPPVPSYTKFYLFSVENKDEVNDYGAKPVLKEMGPYVFRKELKRVISGWNDAEGTILYKEVPDYYYEPSKSTGSLSDTINHVNMVSIYMMKSSQLDMLAEIVPLNKSDFIMNAPGNLVETHTVEELLFKGFDFRGYIPPYNTSLLCQLKDNCTFGMYYGKNGTESSTFEVRTGQPHHNDPSLAEAMEHYREIVTYNEERKLAYWNGGRCIDINGTDGTQFPPRIRQSETYYVLVTEICRFVGLQFEKNVELRGINALRYSIPSKAFAAPSVNPDNACFCKEVPCKSKGGVLPVEPCHDGYPFTASAPHFYLADQEYVYNFIGLMPVQEKHESFLDIEQMTGTVIRASKRLQLNLQVDPDPAVRLLRNIKNKLVFPILWVDEGEEMDQKSADTFFKEVITPYRAGKWTLIAVITAGTLIVTITWKVVLCVLAAARRAKLNRNASEPDP